MSSRVGPIKWNISLVAVVMLVIFLLYPAVIFAYDLTGYTWDDVDPLYYYMENWVGYRTRTAFISSVEDWNATSTPVNFQNSGNYDVYLGETRRSDVIWDGITYLYVQGSTIVGASCYLNMYYTDGYGANERRSVSGHELGHALGLGEMGYSHAVLMNYATYWRYEVHGVYTPQQDDINGVNAMY